MYHRTITLTALALASVSTLAASVTEFAVSPEAKARQDIWPLVTQAILAGHKDDSITVFDPKTASRIATIRITEEMAQSPNQNAKTTWLMKQHPEPIAKLKQFFADKSAGTSNSDFIQYLKSLQLRRTEYPGATIQAIYIGSPLVLKPDAYSMVNRYPSDAFLSTPDTIYSVVGKAGHLQGITVHLVHSPDMNEFSTKNKDLHQSKIKRFYGLFVGGMGGSLATFSGSLDHLKNVSSTRYPVVDYGRPDRGDGKLRIHEILEPRLELEDQSRQTSLWEKSAPTASAAPSRVNAPLDIGITWNQNIDLDIYVQAEGDSELYYGAQASQKYTGRFMKDIQNLPESRGFETVTFSGDVPLKRVKVYVNHYAGTTAQPTEAEIRIRVDGNIYSKKFRLPSGSGTRGAGSRDNNPSWVKIDLAAILGV